MPSFQIPKSSIFLQRNLTFTGTFNVPTLGVYDFGVAGNTNVLVFPMDPNSLYLFSAINVGGDVPEGNYLEAISTFPSLFFRYSVGGTPVFPNAIPIVNYLSNTDSTSWFYSERTGDTLVCTFSGVLSPTAYLVGKATVRVSVGLTFYQITDKGFITSFKNDNLSVTTGARSERFITPSSVVIK